MSAADLKIPQLVESVALNLGDIVRNEIKLARAEVKKGAAEAIQGLVMMGAALVLAIPAVTILAIAIVQGLVDAGLEAWLASLIVALVLAGIAVAIFMGGRKALTSEHVRLEATTQNISQDIKTLKESAT
jgi:uncharacterized membrane protein YqjE